MPAAPVSPAPLTHSDTRKVLAAAVNATALFVLAYLLVQGAFLLATAGTAARLGIRSVLHLGRLEFLLTDAQWWRAAVLAVYGVGPAAAVALGLLALAGHVRYARRRRGLLKLFLLWVVLHALNLALGALATDTLTQSGTWYVPSWLFRAGNAVNVVAAVLAALLQLGLGFALAPLFLQSHDSFTLMRFQNRRMLLLSTLLAPWLAGSLLVAALHWPGQALNEQLHFAALGLALGPLAVASQYELPAATVPFPAKTRVAAGWLLVLATALVLWRLVLGHGVSFG